MIFVNICNQSLTLHVKYVLGYYFSYYSLRPGLLGLLANQPDCFSKAPLDVRARCPRSPPLNARPLAAALGESLHASVEPGVRNN